MATEETIRASIGILLDNASLNDVILFASQEAFRRTIQAEIAAEPNLASPYPAHQWELIKNHLMDSSAGTSDYRAMAVEAQKRMAVDDQEGFYRCLALIFKALWKAH